MRAAAVAVVAVVVWGFASSVQKAWSDLHFVRSADARYYADLALDRFSCVRGAIAATPPGPTFLVTGDGIVGEEWYQRSIEFGFDEVDFVDRREDAEQVLEVRGVDPGTGSCGDVDVRVVAP